MKISIVTPVYNDVRVARALDSVLGQRLQGELETIVIDGASKDGTLKILENYRSRLSVLLSEDDRGIYDAMNKGVQRATGEIVGILNADDRYADENVLQDVLKAFEDPSVQAVYGDLVYVDANDSVVRYWRSVPYRRWRFYLGWMAPHPTFFVRRSLYQQHGLFDLKLGVSADYEIILRFLMKHRAKPAYVPRVLVRMATGGNSNKSLRNILRGNKEVLMSWRKNRLPMGYFVPVIKPFSKLVQFVSRPIG
ncbi:MAG: glycosyltransferase [Chloroflexi bacterium]|nr:glycosyltransferase [Chloroflexota bacterium]